MSIQWKRWRLFIRLKLFFLESNFGYSFWIYWPFLCKFKTPQSVTMHVTRIGLWSINFIVSSYYLLSLLSMFSSSWSQKLSQCQREVVSHGDSCWQWNLFSSCMHLGCSWMFQCRSSLFTTGWVMQRDSLITFSKKQDVKERTWMLPWKSLRKRYGINVMHWAFRLEVQWLYYF